MSSDVRRDVGAERPVGFHAQLVGASLWDLVQLECLARSHLVVEVTGEGGVGYLYFDAGRVVHASTLRFRGLPAALEILGWTHGTFQTSGRSWPVGASTIEVPSESLLLQAAKRRDEQGASNLVAFPGRALETSADSALEEVELLELGKAEEPTRPRQVEETEEGSMSMRTNVEEPPIPPQSARAADSGADFPVMVRLSTQGAVLRNKGGTEELAEATAYAHRLVQLIGELLGLEEFVALECAFTNDRFIIFTEGDGDVVALRPRPDANLGALRERLGL
jgi:hypothetical protein